MLKSGAREKRRGKRVKFWSKIIFDQNDFGQK